MSPASPDARSGDDRTRMTGNSEVMQLNPIKRSRASSGFPRQLQLGAKLLWRSTVFNSWGVAYELKTDRKSTRLNSSHTVISYAVFCLKKKKPTENPPEARTQLPS